MQREGASAQALLSFPEALKIGNLPRLNQRAETFGLGPRAFVLARLAI